MNIILNNAIIDWKFYVITLYEWDDSCWMASNAMVCGALSYSHVWVFEEDNFKLLKNYLSGWDTPSCSFWYSHNRIQTSMGFVAMEP